MAYYPSNFYSSYNYNTPQPQYQQSVYPQQMPQIQMGLQGKIVESEDIVKVTDIPIGGYGIFPKADLSEIYIKTWNGNGTTNIMTFQPVVKQEAVKEAARILSTNPPGDLNNYTPEMLNALVGSKDNPKKWENYLVHMGMEKSGIKSIS